MSIPNYKFQGTKQGLQISTVKTINTDPDHLNDSFLHQGRYEEEEEDEDDEEELIRVVLRPKYTSGLSACFDQKQKYCEMDGKVRKTFSMRSADEQDDDDKKQSSSVVERAVRRAFSMRASSASVNEVYRRIDHRYDQVLVGDEEIAEIKPYKKRNNKIFEACRRFFGF